MKLKINQNPKHLISKIQNHEKKLSTTYIRRLNELNNRMINEMFNNGMWNDTMNSFSHHFLFGTIKKIVLRPTMMPFVLELVVLLVVAVARVDFLVLVPLHWHLVYHCHRHSHLLRRLRNRKPVGFDRTLATSMHLPTDVTNDCYRVSHDRW